MLLCVLLSMDYTSYASRIHRATSMCWFVCLRDSRTSERSWILSQMKLSSLVDSLKSNLYACLAFSLACSYSWVETWVKAVFMIVPELVVCWEGHLGSSLPMSLYKHIGTRDVKCFLFLLSVRAIRPFPLDSNPRMRIR
jgi:hypothetical protein